MHSTNYWGSIAVKNKHNLTIVNRFFLGLTAIAVIIMSFPHVTAAATLQALPLTFETDNLQGVQAAKTTTVEAETEAVLHPAAPDPKTETLRKYLLAKGSPMADYAADLLAQDKFEFIIGISFAESNFCKYNIRPHNCWGIGGGKPESYSDYPAAFARANRLISRYHDRGMITPAAMRNTWVGWNNHNWIIAVNQVMAELEALGL